MVIERIVPNRFAEDAEAGQQFFTHVLGLDIAMSLDFITTYRAPGFPAAQLSVLSADPSGLKPDYSVGVDDVDVVHARAVADGHEIILAPRDEPWGVRRFFVRDPIGGLANMVQNKV
ncbi:MAG: glyoxalase [Pseudomonadota bacterium]|nr:glyoxalase [Pseudomonadota bacterium]